MEDEPTKTEGLYINRHWRNEHDIKGVTWSAGYHDDDHICYFTAEGFIAQHIFNFCGCGDIESTLQYLRDHMQLLDDHKKARFTLGNRFTYTPAEYLVWYELDRVRLTEHGGAVPGWLTDYGEQLLHDLNIMYPKGDSQ